jgi:hypothetical protein
VTNCVLTDVLIVTLYTTVLQLVGHLPRRKVMANMYATSRNLNEINRMISTQIGNLPYSRHMIIINASLESCQQPK